MAIGETFLGAVLAVIIERLASQNVINFFKHSKLDMFLVNDLKMLMLASEKLLDDAEEKQVTDNVVKLWLDELKHWFYRAEEVVDEIATEALRSSLESSTEPHSLGTRVRNLIPAFSESSSFNKTITLKIREITSMLERMLSQKDVLGLKEGSAGRAPRTVPTTCLLEDSGVYGRDQEREEILEYVLSEEEGSNTIGVVSIVGMGGMGKTTLAKLIYNDGRLEKAFHLKVWVCVTNQFDISRVTRSILELVTRQSYSSSLDLNFLQIELSGELRGKRFLLVLDDYWNEKYEDWERLRAPFSVGANGSKIIVTTRNDGVASIMRTKPVSRLKPLSDEDGWALFIRHAFGVGNLCSNPTLKLLGRKLVHRCRGLPLAIKTLGGVLRSKQEMSEWQAILQSNLWDLPAGKSDVIPALRLSYYYLPSHLKRCFSYCAVFPKNYPIDTTKLVLLWMAEDFVHSRSSDRSLEDTGNDYLHQLLAGSFFERIDASFVMIHDLMHDLAQVVSGETFTRLEHDKLSKVSRNTRYFSYIRGRFDGITIFEGMHEAGFLRTLLPLQTWASKSVHREAYFPNIYHAVFQPSETLPSYCFLSNKIPAVVISQCYNLRVLSLSKYRNLRLPESIGNLKQLRYLDVSDSGIIQLPDSLCTLYNLQTILLSSCRHLKRLPTDMWKLVSLRHLDISGSLSLLEMPKQMGNLKSLQTLTSFFMGKHSGPGIEELRKFPHIRGKLVLRRLQNVAAAAALEANLSSREYLDDLIMQFDSSGNNDSEKGRVVLENLKPHVNLRRLTIVNYAGTRFPSWLDTHWAPYRNITYLRICDCLYCYSLPPFGQLPSLKTLIIEGMNYLKAVGPEFYGYHSSLSSPFPALECLAFQSMEVWDEWSTVDVEGGALPFPCLESLLLIKCPKLKGKLPVHIPSLKKLHIDRCEQLTGSLPQLPSLHFLYLRLCPQVAAGSAFHLTSITFMRLKGFMHLQNLPSELVRLSSLKYLGISCCDNLKSLTDVQLPLKLQTLYVEECQVLESLPEAMALHTHLKRLRLDMCPSLTSSPIDMIPTSLQTLHVSDCWKWEFPIPMERMHLFTSLERLWISEIGGPLVSFPLGIFPNLCSLKFESWDNLESLCLSEGNTKGLMSLHELRITYCPNLRFIGETTSFPAPNLSILEIRNCDIVKPLLIDAEDFPASLASLTLQVFDEITSCWISKGLLRFSCLRELFLCDSDEEFFLEVSLPISLTKLCIEEFFNLKFLDGKALKNLTSLEELAIANCPKLQCLPEEGLPPSLACLELRSSPLLEERCQGEKGLDWTKINHIPCIKINGNCISSP